MANTAPKRFRTISEFHQFRALPKPEHPLVSLINVDQVKQLNMHEPLSLTTDFYFIALKKHFNAKVKYGQQAYDFDEGLMTFMAPGQVFKVELAKDKHLTQSGWVLLIHPDFLWNTALAKKIRTYGFFDYATNEALFLSEREEEAIIGIFNNIEREYKSNIDKFSQDVIVAQLELLLTYSARFYDRQFITRKISNHHILAKVDEAIAEYFNRDDLTQAGLPTVGYIAEKLNISPTYLSAVLRMLTGQNTQQHIHNKMIEKAKEKLSTTDLSVGEIAYNLGFEHVQSFSKLFKTKTKVSPSDFRQLFN